MLSKQRFKSCTIKKRLKASPLLHIQIHYHGELFKDRYLSGAIPSLKLILITI